MRQLLLPPHIHDALLAGHRAGSSRGVALFVDLSGFTQLSERLMASGQEGAELLAAAMRAFFTPQVDAVRGQGGFIVNFMGDALIAVFPTAERAVAAAVGIRDDVVAHPGRAVGGQELTFKVTLGVGASTKRPASGGRRPEWTWPGAGWLLPECPPPPLEFLILWPSSRWRSTPEMRRG